MIQPKNSKTIKKRTIHTFRNKVVGMLEQADVENHEIVIEGGAREKDLTDLDLQTVEAIKKDFSKAP